MRKKGNHERFGCRRLFAFLALAFYCDCRLLLAQPQPRVIEILADHDSRYKMTGLKQPLINVKAGEEILLRITAKKAQNHNRDGSIHGFSLLRAKDRQPVPGWDLLLKPGTQEFTLTAPTDAGDYLVICTVICSPDHEQMNMKFVVEP
jgi:heme/copper-type cytochrome/quinol oxidase subunit 2